MYNYYEAMKEDVQNYINYEVDLDEYKGRRDELEEKLNDDLWINDSVTGNASGSYTFNTAKAMEYVNDNLDLLREAYVEFGNGYEEVGKDFIEGDYEKMDVTIRCYLLGQTIAEILDEYDEDGIFDEIDEEIED